MMQSGDQKKGAGITVYLIRDTPELQQAHARICAEYESAYAVAEAENKAAWDAVFALPYDSPDRAAVQARHDRASKALFAIFDATSARVDEMLASNSAARAGTGMNAHYEFTGVPPGQYRLFAATKIGANDYQWWAPVSLAPGMVLKRDLDNSTEAQGKVYCGIK